MGVKVREWKGAWWLFVDHQGRRKARRVGVGKAGKKSAELAAIQIQAKLAEGDGAAFNLGRTTCPTFATVAEEWLRKYPLRRAVRPNTMENYTSFARHHLIPFFGPMPITAITHESIENFIEAKRAPGGALRGGKGLSDASLKVGCIVLALILRRAQKDKLIGSNPWDLAEWSRVRRMEHVDPFTPAELRAILGAAETIDHDLAALIRVWAQSGGRAGEIFALRPEDVDLEPGLIHIRRTWSRRRLGPTKTGRDRCVSFLHPVTETTSEWRPGVTADSRAVLAALRGLAVQPIDPTGFLFTRKGAPWNGTVFNAAWRRVLARAHVRYRNPEQLRHTLASVLLSRNAPLLYVQRVGGWKSATVLLGVYARWLPQDVAEGVPAQPGATQAQPPGLDQQMNA
jgi:integrase